MSPLLTDAWALAEKLSSKPRVLFTFAIGGRMWRYAQTVGDVTVAASGLTYKAAQIQVDSDVERQEEIGAQRVTVRIGIRADVVAALRANQTEPMYLGIHRYQPSVVAAPARWAFGEIASVRVQRGWCLVELQTEEGAWELDVPRAIFATQCQKATYSAECGLNADDFSIATTITAVDGASVTVSSVGGNPDDWYSKGLLKIGNSVWHVVAQIGTALRIFGSLPRGLVLPAAATLIAGDDLTHETCRDKFNNLDRFLGFKWLPSKNPLINLEHRGPDILVTTHELPDDPGYVRPAKFLWYRGDTPNAINPGVDPNDPNKVFDVAGNVQTWNDVTGNARSATESIAAERPGYVGQTLPVSQTPSQESDGVGFATQYQTVIDVNNRTVQLALPSLSALVDTCDFYYTINLDVEDPDSPTPLFSIHNEGNGTADSFLLPGRKLQIGFGTTFGGRVPFIMPLPSIPLQGRDAVLNITATPARYSVRLNNSLIFTTTPGDNSYGLNFSQIAPTLGGTFPGSVGYIARRLLMYPAALNSTDRATTYAYMKTGIGAPV